jgi:hypothetical protein
MAASASLEPRDPDYLQQVMKLAAHNPGFRKGLVQDPATAIDDFKSELGFDHTALSDGALGLLGTLTDDELNAITELWATAKQYGIDGTMMMPL